MLPAKPLVQKVVDLLQRERFGIGGVLVETFEVCLPEGLERSGVVEFEEHLGRVRFAFELGFHFAAVEAEDC